MKFFTTATLGPKRRYTPEGFLVCIDSVLARTGQQSYFKRENPEFMRDPMFPERFVVDRLPEDLFAPEVLASVNGKPLTNDHPPDWVTPDNYKRYSIGHVMNVHQGTGDDADVMLGDIMVTDASAIGEIERGKKELSLGYNARYEPTSHGMFLQKDFRANHTALVNKGRCGPRCSINDAAHCECEDCNKMGNRAKVRKSSVMDKLRNVFKTGDEAEQERVVEELMGAEDPVDDAAGGADDTHLHVHLPESGASPLPGASDAAEPPYFKSFRDAMESRMSALEGKAAAPAVDAEAPTDEDKEIEGQIKAEAPAGVTGDRMVGAKDSALLYEAFQETASMAEAISPGITIPEFERKASPRKTFDSIQALRRSSLDVAYVRPETRGLVEQIVGTRPLETSKMTHDSLRSTFRAVGSLAKKANNNSRTADFRGGSFVAAGKASTIKEINAANAARRTRRQHTPAN